MAGKRLTVKINNNSWLVRLITDKEMDKVAGEGHVGACIWDEDRAGQIVLTRDGLTLATIVHELGHAYLRECPTHSAGLSLEQFEEVVVELYARKWKEIVTTARTILRRLRGR